MSRKRWGRSVVDILRQIGVPLPPDAESKIKVAKEVHPEITTEDIIVQLDLAPPEAVAKAVEIAKGEGSFEVLIDRFKTARASIQATAKASKVLEKIAQTIAQKGEPICRPR